MEYSCQSYRSFNILCRNDSGYRNIDSYGMYSAKQDGENIIVGSEISKDHLVLRGTTEQQKFLDYLDDTYGEDIGVEALYNFNRAMGKDD